MSRRERVSGGGIVTRRSPSMTVWHASAYPASRSAPERRRVDRRRNPPPSSWTEQRPQRPWPPQGWATSIPARRGASTTSDPGGASTGLPSGRRGARGGGRGAGPLSPLPPPPPLPAAKKPRGPIRLGRRGGKKHSKGEGGSPAAPFPLRKTSPSPARRQADVAPPICGGGGRGQGKIGTFLIIRVGWWLSRLAISCTRP